MRIRYTLLAAVILILGSSALAQTIPNGNFEEWSDGNPAGWFTSNSAGVATPVTQSTMHADGQFGVEGRVVDFLGFPMPPLLATGDFVSGAGGFHIQGRPEAFNGFIGGQMQGGDAIQVVLSLSTKEGETVGAANLNIPNPSTGLSAFSIPIQYVSQAMPDTAVIVIQLTPGSTTHTLGSVFFVDALTFGAVQQGSVVDASNSSKLTVSRSSRYHEIAFSAETSANSTLDVVDIHGRIMATIFEGVTTGTTVRWSDRSLANGVYFVRLTRPDGMQIAKLVVQH
jgi:hypothetical protein